VGVGWVVSFFMGAVAGFWGAGFGAGATGLGFDFAAAFFGVATLIVFLTRYMPHFGQLPGLAICTSGCMGQVYIVLVCAVAEQ